jgi:hypothetical protein
MELLAGAPISTALTEIFLGEIIVAFLQGRLLKAVDLTRMCPEVTISVSVDGYDNVGCGPHATS